MQHQPLHKLWNCSLAQAEWTSLRKEWASVGRWRTTADFQKDIFTWQCSLTFAFWWDQPDVRSKCAYDPDGQTHKRTTDSILLRYNISAGTHEAVWMTAHFLGLSSTNNQAEYTALLLGLQAAARLQARPLQVVGDSLMIIRQHRANHAPINKHLAGLFQRTKRTADHLGVYQWHHHHRCHNKMADHVANVAMDLQAHRSWPSTEHFELDGC